MYCINCQLHPPGDFFKPGLPKADLFLISRCLHDWADERCHVMIVNVVEAVPKG